jgi:hypothetical protein
MGARIVADGRTAVVKGVRKLIGTRCWGNRLKRRSSISVGRN